MLLQPQPLLVTKVKPRKAGFTLVELLISLAVLTVVIFLSLGLIIPLRVTRASNLESQALNYAKSYTELVKIFWAQSNKYGPNIATVNTDFAGANPLYWPRIGSGNDIELATGWTLLATVASANNSTALNAKFTSPTLTTLADTLRLLTVTVTPPANSGGKPIELTTLITRPSSGVLAVP